MFLYNLARKVNAQLKKQKKAQAGKLQYPVRRIEYVSAPKGRRVCAMTFDDGPCALAPNPWEGQEGLTEVLLDTLKRYGARATFDVVGDTGKNYPDEEGPAGNFTWSGVKFDHYPCFGKDSLAGAVNQPDLIRRILDEGHELANHGYTHRLFGPMRAVYGGRVHFQTLDEVTADLFRLHNYIKDTFGYEMKLSRPPHYIDAIPQGGSSYDAYRVLGYQYMAASFDGAGWQPRATYEEEVADMVVPLEKALREDPDSLNGKIIFQKDGSNMSLRTPVAHALPKQLELLKSAGYEVVTVSELLAMSPFEDVPADAAYLPALRELLDMGHAVGYRNNSFQPQKTVTKAEFCLMLTPPEILRQPKPLTQKELLALGTDYVHQAGIALPAGLRSMTRADAAVLCAQLCTQRV